MAAVYADLVIKGKKTLDDIPSKLLDEVKENLIVKYVALIIKGEKTIDDVPSEIREAVEEALVD